MIILLAVFFSEKVKLFLWLFLAWQKPSELFAKSSEDTVPSQHLSGELSHLIALLQCTARILSQNVPQRPAHLSPLSSPSSCQR